jgi:ribulose-5-phosphate 4-epimerase/fuculose-1-phosphate aldolase
MSEGYFGNREKLYLDDLKWGLITSSHILHHHGIVDAYGHISVRNPDNSKTFFLSRNMPPALMTTAEDIVEYQIEDADPVEKDAPKGFAERYIHSEIFKKFPTVNAVLHAHAPAVLPFGITGVSFKPAFHMAGFLGSEVPVWDINDAYSSSDSRHDLLVKTAKVGHHLAAAFKPSTSAGFLTQKLRSALPSQIGGNAGDPSTEPTHPVVLMRGHGFTTCADGLEAVVYQAIYTVEAAKVQTEAITMHNAYFGSTLDGKVEVENGGRIKSAKVKSEGGEIKYLSSREADDAWIMNRETMSLPWALWVREVEVNPLYRNKIKREAEK